MTIKGAHWTDFDETRTDESVLTRYFIPHILCVGFLFLPPPSPASPPSPPPRSNLGPFLLYSL